MTSDEQRKKWCYYCNNPEPHKPGSIPPGIFVCDDHGKLDKELGSAACVALLRQGLAQNHCCPKRDRVVPRLAENRGVASGRAGFSD